MTVLGLDFDSKTCHSLGKTPNPIFYFIILKIKEFLMKLEMFNIYLTVSQV